MKRKMKAAPLVILVAALALLFLLNPSMTDFSNYYQQRVKNSVSSEVGTTGLGKLITSAAGGLASIGADQFKRGNFYLASVYTMTIRNEIQEQYLGIAKFFIQIKGRK
ncbi:MAG: hypothetical protein KKI09_13410 [Spirochaetes bacterium]|nr:hypothetical protein [Spirochaetota bacterium]MBU0956422.1 hypothetical protein [Spirochaetota bacterium]